MGWYEDKERDVAKRRTWSESYNALVKSILGQVLFTEAPLEIDRYEASDIIYKVSGRGDVGVRIRKPECFEKYRFDVTFRAENGRAKKTEIDKIIDGRGTWMFYAIAAPDNRTFLSWVLLDLNAWRAARFRGEIAPVIENKSNFDGTGFDVYDLRSFRNSDPPIIVAASDPELTSGRGIVSHVL